MGFVVVAENEPDGFNGAPDFARDDPCDGVDRLVLALHQFTGPVDDLFTLLRTELREA